MPEVPLAHTGCLPVPVTLAGPAWHACYWAGLWELTTSKDAKETLYKSLRNQRAEMHVMIEKYGTPPTIFKRVHFVKNFNDIRGGEVSGIHKELGEDL